MEISDDAILNRLDLILSTLRLAFQPQLKAAREAIREDDIAAAILDGATEWIPSRQLQSRVAKSTGKTERSVRNRLPELVTQGVLQMRGSDSKPEYRSTGLV